MGYEILRHSWIALFALLLAMTYASVMILTMKSGYSVRGRRLVAAFATVGVLAMALAS